VEPQTQQLVDEALLLIMRLLAPTPAKMWWSSIATGIMAVQQVLQLCLEQEQASQPGEFTLRAF